MKPLPRRWSKRRFPISLAIATADLGMFVAKRRPRGLRPLGHHLLTLQQPHREAVKPPPFEPLDRRRPLREGRGRDLVVVEPFIMGAGDSPLPIGVDTPSKDRVKPQVSIICSFPFIKFIKNLALILGQQWIG